MLQLTGLAPSNMAFFMRWMCTKLARSSFFIRALKLQTTKRIQCSGIIVPSHGTDRGSIPRMRIVCFGLFFLLFLFCFFPLPGGCVLNFLNHSIRRKAGQQYICYLIVQSEAAILMSNDHQLDYLPSQLSSKNQLISSFAKRIIK